jgi:hypothetical protein
MSSQAHRAPPFSRNLKPAKVAPKANKEKPMTDQSSELFPAELRQMLQLIYGFMISQAIAVATKLGIADLLEERPRRGEELANATKAHAPSLNRLLRMLTSVGIFAKDANDRFEQTRLSEFLGSNHPRSTRALAIMWGSEFWWRPGGICSRQS